MRVAAPGPSRPSVEFRAHNLIARHGEVPRTTATETGGRPPVTRPELGLYTIKASFAAPFWRVRSHWGSRVTADTENNPLIGLPNEHIVGLTYVA
ncbi:hypothetical protein GCM10010234_52870 [Streptomyces hawaiiensis]